MNIAIRDEILLEVFSSIIEGLNYLKLNQFELHLNNDFQSYSLNSSHKVSIKSEEQLFKYKKELQEKKVFVSALLTDFDVSMHTKEQSIDWFKNAVNIAYTLGSKVIRIDSSLQQEHLYSFGEKVELFSNIISELFSEIENISIRLGIENHGKEGNNPIFLLSVVHTVGDPRLGLTLDLGNFYWRGYPLSETEAILKLLAPYAKHTHIKNIAYPKTAQEIYREIGWEYATYVCPIFKGDINIETILTELKKSNYDGVLCIEDESLGNFSDPIHKREILKQDVEFLIEITNDIQFDN
ncbi:MAG: sugar phosphate isomerase/epimerase family protein [Candidatus Hydrogenedens sp.]